MRATLVVASSFLWMLAGNAHAVEVATSDAMHSASRVPGATMISGGSLFLPIVCGGLE